MPAATKSSYEDSGHVRVPISEFKKAGGKLAERVHHLGERISITKHSESYVYLVSPNDVAFLERVEDLLDAQAIREAVETQEGPGVRFEDLLSKLSSE